MMKCQNFLRTPVIKIFCAESEKYYLLRHLQPIKETFCLPCTNITDKRLASPPQPTVPDLTRVDLRPVRLWPGLVTSGVSSSSESVMKVE